MAWNCWNLTYVIGFYYFLYLNMTFGMAKLVGETQQKIIETIIDANIEEPDDCISMIVGHTDFRASMPKLQIRDIYFRNHQRELDKYFHRTTECIVAFVDTKASFSNAMRVINKVDSSLLITYEDFEIEEMAKFDRLIAYIGSNDNARISIKLLCPKEDKNAEPSLKIMSLSYSTLKSLDKESLRCPSFVSGQSLSFAYVPGGSGSKIVNGKIIDGGYMAKMFGYLANKFKFNPVFRPGSSTYHARNNSWGGGHYHLLKNSKELFHLKDVIEQISVGKCHVCDQSFNEQVQQGSYFMGYGRISYRYHSAFEIMYPHHLSYINFVSRSPRPSERFYVQLLPFNNLIWGLIYFTLTVFSLCFLVTHRIYQSSHLRHHGLHRTEDSNVVFLLYTMAKITEPDSIPWFSDNKWSTGKLLTILWSLFCLLIVMFYTSNLRAHLSALEYDERIDTLQDVLDNGGKPWIMLEMTAMRKDYVEKMGLKGTALHKVTEMAQKMGGYYKISDYGTIPLAAIKDIVENDAVALMGKRTLRQLRTMPAYKEVMKEDRLYVAAEKIYKFQFCMLLRKHSPMRHKVYHAVAVATEFGLPLKWPQDHLPAEALIEYHFERSNEQKPLLLSQLSMTSQFWAGGMTVALIAFAYEMFKYRRVR